MSALDSDSDNGTVQKSQVAAKKSSRLVTKRVGSEMVIFDLEATGLNNPIQPIEFGAFVIDKSNHKILIKFRRLIKPTVMIEAGATAVHKLTADQLAHKPLFREVAESIHEILDGRIWIGHNIKGYDIPVLEEAFKKVGMAMPKTAGVIDTLPLFRSKFGNRAGDCKLQTIADFFNIKSEKHRALADCETTLKVMEQIGLASMLADSRPGMFPKVKGMGTLIREHLERSSSSSVDIYDSDNEFFVGHGS